MKVYLSPAAQYRLDTLLQVHIFRDTYYHKNINFAICSLENKADFFTQFFWQTVHEPISGTFSD